MTLFELLTTLNPWWTGQEFEEGKPRHAYSLKIHRYIGTDAIMVLNGVRRSGKTTLLFQTIKYLINDLSVPPRNILFVNCDEPEISSLEDPLSKVVDTYHKEVPAKGLLYLVFDEIQSIPGWERTIKSLYDRKIQDNRLGLFFVSPGLAIIDTALRSFPYYSGISTGFQRIPHFPGNRDNRGPGRTRCQEIRNIEPIEAVPARGGVSYCRVAGG